MAADLVSVVMVGDSHVIGMPKNRIDLDLEGRIYPVALNPVRIDGAWGAMDMVVSFPDGRAGLNPTIEMALNTWPGVGKHEKTPEGGTVAKHVVLSFGLGLTHYDPGIEFADRAQERLLFRSDIDFLLPERPDLGAYPGHTLLPAALIQDMYEAVLAPMKQAVPMIVARYPRRTWVMAAPPPPRDVAILEDIFTRRAKAYGLDPEQVQIPAPRVLLKIWTLLRRSVLKICADTGCGFIDCADFAAGADGFLKPEFVGDGVHGNPKYMGAMAIKVLSTLVKADA